MLQFITDGQNVNDTVKQALDAIKGGCRWVQIRMKTASDEEVIEAANRILPYAREHDATVLLDDRVNLAKLAGADGVHLGKDDMSPEEARKILGSKAIIGVTVNTLEDILAVDHDIIDYMGMGPFRFTTTKKNLAAILGTEGYRKTIAEIRKRGISTPVIAIGGITISDIDELMDTGISGVAVSGAIGRADNPEKATKEFIESLNQKHK